MPGISPAAISSSSGDPSAGGPWVQAGPGSWVSDAPGALRSVTGVAGQGTFAVTQPAEDADGSYVMRFTVDEPSKNASVVLAAKDTANYLDLRENSAYATWSFGEVQGGDRVVRSKETYVALERGDEVEIDFEAPRVEVRIDGEPVASARLTAPATGFWVGFLTDREGFSVNGLSVGPR